LYNIFLTVQKGAKLMRTISTLNNGNIYLMDITEAIEIVQAYARQNTGGDLLAACEEMTDLVTLDQLPVKQKVAIRRFMRDMGALFAPKVDA
jgi:hypothetical protein